MQKRSWFVLNNIIKKNSLHNVIVLLFTRQKNLKFDNAICIQVRWNESTIKKGTRAGLVPPTFEWAKLALKGAKIAFRMSKT